MLQIGYMVRKFLVSIFIFLVTSASFSLLRPSFARAQDCGGPIPPAPLGIKAVTGLKAGEVTLFWQEAAHANRYAVAYGKASNNYSYGANNIGGEHSRSYTVKSLIPGVRYYFRVAAARDCSSSPFSAEVSAVAGGGKTVIPATPALSAKPPSTSSYPSLPSPTLGPVGKQMLKAVSGPRAGEVTLSWQPADSADNYHLVYGRQLGKFEYGALNLGNIASFTVGHLTPGATYYFALVPLVGGRPLYTTSAVAGQAKGAVFSRTQVIHTTREALITPPPAQVTLPPPPPTLFEQSGSTLVPSPEATSTP